MKIAVSSGGTGLTADVDPRFGRCPYFLLVDPETMELKAVENSGLAATGGAGIAAAQQVAAEKAEAVLTGHCGPNAFSTLQAAGIRVITGVSGTVQDAVRDYKAGKYAAADQPDVSPHAGMGGN
ncbi:NifB/NifX family molybdenum-iron cluster-binding protein [Chloroflexota bacterium]